MKKIILLSLSIGFSSLAFTQVNKTKVSKDKIKPTKEITKPVDRSVKPQAGAAPAINIKDSEVFTTGNGITVILSENHKLPKVSINLVMGSDPMMEGPKAGISSLASELIMSGTTNRTKDQLDSEIDYIGASINASSESIFLSCLTKHLPKAMDLYSDIVFNTNFPQAEFDRIVKQNESNLKSAKSSPEQIADNVEKKANFKGHPYGEVMTEATLAAITRDDVVSYYKRVFTPTGSYMVIVGDITKDEAIKMVNTFFGSWKGEKNNKMNLGAGNFNKGNRVIFVKKAGAVQSTISVSFPFKMKPGDANQVPLSVLNNILGGGGFGTRLMQNLREDKAYTYGCYSALNITDNGSWFSASGNFRNEVSDSAITQILFELDKITKGEVSDDELNLTKSSMAGGFARSLESPATVARFALNIIQNNLPKDYYQTYLKRLEAVDKATILKMAQTYFTASNCNIVVVGNEDIVEKLKVFDADGKIEFLDAFGDEVVSIKKADITKEQLMEKYIFAVTQTTNMKAAKKKISKVKSMKQEIEMKNPSFPGVLLMTTYFASPAKEAMKMEMQGMVIQKSYFDGTKGANVSMQTGKSEMSAEEISAKKKSIGLFPEFNYATAGMTYELIGIETVKNKDYYVVKTNDGQAERMDYYDVKTFMKMQSVQSEEGQETITTFDEFKDVNGFLFPHKVSLIAGGMSFEGASKSLVVNGKIEGGIFE
ncbi:MAG: M16 family metallopeptidase [Flavobacteriia bacterium]|jgi:zinc protease